MRHANSGTGIEDQYRSAGLRIANVRIERRQFGTNDGLLADFENDMSTVADAPFAPRMRQWQAVFVAWGKAYIITCTAPSDSFARLEPIFTATLASVDFPTTPVAVLRGLPRWMQTALIGALIGALLSLVPMLLKPLFAEAPSQAPASTSLRNEDATKSEKDV